MTGNLWQRGCDRLAAELPEQQFNTWIRPLPQADVNELGEAGTVVSVRVPNRFKLDWIRNQYAGRIESVLSELAGRPVRLDLTLAQREPTDQPAARHGNGADLLAGEIDLHPAAHTDAAPAGLARRTVLIAGAVAAVLLALVAVWGLRRGRAARMGNTQRVGGAA